LIFRKKKYYYNPDTLIFEEIRHDKNDRAKRFMIIAVSLAVFIVLSGYLLNQFLGSPEAIFLEKKVSWLSGQLNELLEKSEGMEETLYSTTFENDNLYRIILGLDTLPLSVRSGGTGGSAEDDIGLFNSSVSNKLEVEVEKLRLHYMY